MRHKNSLPEIDELHESVQIGDIFKACGAQLCRELFSVDVVAAAKVIKGGIFIPQLCVDEGIEYYWIFR